jgi:hypothetical protein
MFHNLSETISETIKNSLPMVDVAGIQSKLDELGKDIVEFKTKIVTTTPEGIASVPTFRKPPPQAIRKTMTCPERPYQDHREDFTYRSTYRSLIDLLAYLKDGVILWKKMGIVSDSMGKRILTQALSLTLIA